ncbi:MULTISPECIES: hypothetical protein [unclassified Streptomyces]
MSTGEARRATALCTRWALSLQLTDPYDHFPQAASVRVKATW